MPCFERTEYNLKKQDPGPETSGQDDSRGGTPIPKLSQSDHFVAGLGVIVAVILIITTVSRINEHVF